MTRILLADDHPLVRRGLRSCLESVPGWEICGEAGDGEQAVALASSLLPDIAVVDMIMPGLSGAEVAQRIRNQCSSCAVLLLSDQHARNVVEDAIARGAQGCVLKSDPPDELVNAVRSLVDSNTYFSKSLTRNRVAPERLTARESQILQLIAGGLRTKQVAERLGISEKTVESHRSSIFRKLGLNSLADVVRYAVRNGLVDA